VILKTSRFGELAYADADIISVPRGILGFPEYTRFILVDPADDTLILWFQSVDKPDLAFPVLEPKIFRPDYAVRLSAAELRDLKLENLKQSAVYSILTIPGDVSAMAANLKAPLVINLKEGVAKQVVLQENEYSVSHPMFKELKTHILTIQAQKGTSEGRTATISVKDIAPSLAVKSLEA
jgi:flagellar assembly factor FliW